MRRGIPAAYGLDGAGSVEPIFLGGLAVMKGDVEALRELAFVGDRRDPLLDNTNRDRAMMVDLSCDV